MMYLWCEHLTIILRPSYLDVPLHSTKRTGRSTGAELLPLNTENGFMNTLSIIQITSWKNSRPAIGQSALYSVVPAQTRLYFWAPSEPCRHMSKYGIFGMWVACSSRRNHNPSTTSVFCAGMGSKKIILCILGSKVFFAASAPCSKHRRMLGIKMTENDKA